MVVYNFIHNTLHVFTAVIALVLFFLSYFAYRKHGRKKFQIISSAFFVFALKETLLTLGSFGYLINPDSVLFHVFTIIVLILLAIGLLR